MKRLLSAVAALAVGSAASLPAPTATGGAAGPRVDVPAGPLRVGQRVLVSLDAWPAGTVQVEVCGNGGRRGVLDCATGSATHGHVPRTGRATVPVVLSEPPTACPCVLRVRMPAGTAATVELPLTGVSTPPAVITAAPELTLVELAAVNRSGPGGWFGLPGELTVQLTVRNAGPADIVDPPFSLLVGRPGRVPTIVAAPPLGTIGAEQSRSYLVPVPTGDAPLGGYEVHGRIDVPGRPLTFTVEAARRPWGLLAVPATALVLLFARRRTLAAARHSRRP